MLTYVLVALLSFLFVLFAFLKRRFRYWERRNVPCVKPTFLYGNYEEYIKLKEYIGSVAQGICQKFPNEPYVGSYYGTEPALLIQDPDLVKLITTKDYYYFSSREVSKYTHKEVFTQNMFFTYGDRWKLLRQNFTPLFSSAKMKNMFHLIDKCCRVFENLLEDEVKTENVVGIRMLMSKYTMDCIGACVFGVDSNVMKESVTSNPFSRMGNMIFENSNVRGFSLIARAIWPSIFYGLGFKTFPTQINEFFNKLMTGVFQARNYEASARNDFVDLLLNMKKSEYIYGDSIMNVKKGESGKKVSLKVDDELLVAQAISFFAAGFETSATTLAFTLFELAKQPEAQKNAEDEVKAFLEKHKGLCYDCVSNLPYLEACIDEALRLYPVLGVLTREVVSNYTLPTGLVLEKGVRVHLPLYHLQRNPDNFEAPNVFRPERFLPENKKNVKPYTYLPFGEGPRVCIGLRFAKMQMLAGLVTLLNGYRLELAPGMAEEVTFEPRSIVTQPVGDIRLKLTRREAKLGAL